MKIFNYVPSVLTFFIVLGILFGYYIKPEPITAIVGLFIVLLLLSVSYKFSNKSFSRNLHFNVLSYLLFFGIGVLSIVFQYYKNDKNHYSKYINLNEKFILTIKQQLKSNRYYDKYIAKVSQINNIKTNGKVLLNVKKPNLLVLEVDTKIVLNNDFLVVNLPKNPYGFNYKNYLEKQQVHHQITTSINEIKVLKSSYFSIYGLASKFRKKINNSLNKHDFKFDELTIINALILGQRQEVSTAIIKNYQNAGAIHILAVSGLHVGIILLLLNVFLKPLERFKNGKTIKLIVVIILLWFYAILAGFSASVVRSVTMFTAIAFGLLSSKKSSTLNNLFISLFFLLLINPLYIFNVGFQLSYLAVFSIVYFYPLFINFYNPKSFFIKKTWQLVAISISAQIGILPLSLYYFHQFPSLFFVSSLVIIPFLGLILGLGIVVIFLALINFLPNLITLFYGKTISLLNKFIEFIAKQEAFLIKDIWFTIEMVFISYFIIILIYNLISNKKFKQFLIFGLAILLLQITLITYKYTLVTKNEFVVFNKNNHTILGFKTGKKLLVYHNLDTIKNQTFIKNYKTGKRLVDIKYYNTINNIYRYNGQNILVIDSLGVYEINNFRPKVVILTQSPKINLERLIKMKSPKIIIADASNYKNLHKFWQETCIKYNVEFYSTINKGAFRLK